MDNGKLKLGREIILMSVKKGREDPETKSFKNFYF